MAELDTTPLEENKGDRFILEVFKTEESKEVRAFLLSQFMAFFVYMSLRQLFPLYLQIQGFSEEEVVIKWATIVSAYTFAGIFARIPSAWMVEKIGRKMSLTVSFGIMILAVGGLLINYYATGWLAFLFVLQRLANNVFGLASRGLLSDLRSKYKGLYNSLVSSSGRLGTLIGTISLGYILDFLPPITLIIAAFLISVFGLISFRLLFVIGKAENRHFLRRIDIQDGTKIEFDWKVFKSSTFIFFTLSFTIFGLMGGLTDPIYSLYGKNVLNLSESNVGTILGLSQLSFIILSPIIGWIISKKPKFIQIMLIIAALIISGNFLLIYLFPYAVPIYIVILFVKNVAHALFFPVVFTIFTFELPKKHFSMIYSISTTSFFLGVSATSYLSGVLYNKSPELPWLYASIIGGGLVLTVIIYAIFSKITGRVEIAEEKSTKE